MNNDQYKQLIRQAEEKYESAIVEAKEERDDTLKAIEKVWAMLSVNSKENVTEQPIEYGSLTENVKKALESVVGTFDKNDLIRAIGYTPIESSFDGCLRRFVKQGIIMVDVQGKGRRATRYKKAAKETDFNFSL